MTRNNADFQASALYHGTAHPFQIGDVILPAAMRGMRPDMIDDGQDDLSVDSDVHEKVYATDDLGTAHGYAHFNAQDAKDARVYQVEPVDKKETLQVRSAVDGGDVVPNDPREFISKKGFRVVKQVK